MMGVVLYCGPEEGGGASLSGNYKSGVVNMRSVITSNTPLEACVINSYSYGVNCKVHKLIRRSLPARHCLKSVWPAATRKRETLAVSFRWPRFIMVAEIFMAIPR